MTSFIIKTDGSMTVCEPKSKKMGYKLDELYASLNCEMVEVVTAQKVQGFKSPILICDEEALYTDKQTNIVASLLAGVRIIGDAILTESKNLR